VITALVHDLKSMEVNDDSVALIRVKVILQSHPAKSTLAHTRGSSDKHSTVTLARDT